MLRVLKLDRGVEKGYSLYEIETEAHKDLRKEVTQAIVAKGFALVEVQREAKTLEDVFAELTS